MKPVLLIINLCLSLLLVACGGGGSGWPDNTGNDNGTASGAKSNFTLQVTDAPIDNIVAVVLQFTEIRLRRSDGDWISYPLETPKSIDLLKLEGSRTADLLTDEPLPTGRYDEIRLLLDDAPMANYVDLGAGGIQQLDVPSGTSSGLKIKGDFMRNAQNRLTLVIDFDLRQSIRNPGKSGKYMMQPVLRLVDADKSGFLRGQVSALRLSSAGNCSDADPNTYNAVYLFAGHDVIPADIDLGSNKDIDPVATATVRWQPMKAAYEYELGFLAGGDYTLAITCNADLDDLDRGGDDLKFFIVRNVIVTAM